MKIYFTSLMMLVAISIAAQDLKVMSYNLRVDFGGDGENNWEFRRDFLADQLNYYNADFIGTQEGKAHQLQFLDKLLIEHTFIGLSRDNSKKEGEFCAIFYNQQKFKLIEESTFWLSETPEKKSKGWDAAYERICTYGLFEDRKTNKRLYVFNTHLDHIGETARANGAQLIVDKIKFVNTSNLPVIFTGDFNSEKTSAAYQTIVRTMNDTQSISETKSFGPSGTFNGFLFNEPVTLLIDYIFTSKNTIDVRKHAILSDSKDCKYPSDHLPVYAEIHLK